MAFDSPLAIRGCNAVERALDVAQITAEAGIYPANNPDGGVIDSLWYRWVQDACNIAIENVYGDSIADIGGEG